MEKKFYKMGELSKLTGVSYKTIRHYCEKELLQPIAYTESGYKLFDARAVEILQRIFMLKYLNFSLEDIKTILKQEDKKADFHRQEILLREQKEHLEQVLKAVQEIQKVKGEDQWNQLLSIIQMTKQKEEITKQYRGENNLKKRINIHQYSTSKTNWYQWIFDGLELHSGMKILEVGCGNGMQWITIREQLPENLTFILTDNSQEMLETAKQGIKEYETLFKSKNINFQFLEKDAEDFTMEEHDFDRIIANHMLYHVSNANRSELLRRCSSLLNEQGIFYASTVGKTHMGELSTLMHQFDERIRIPSWMSAGFELENGEDQLKKVFRTVIKKEQENDLLVPDPQAIFDYAVSLPGNIREIIEERNDEFLLFLKNRISEDKPYFIHKSTGAFLCKN